MIRTLPRVTFGTHDFSSYLQRLKFSVYHAQGNSGLRSEMKTPRNNLLPEYKARMTSFKPIDDNTREATLERLII